MTLGMFKMQHHITRLNCSRALTTPSLICFKPLAMSCAHQNRCGYRMEWVWSMGVVHGCGHRNGCGLRVPLNSLWVSNHMLLSSLLAPAIIPKKHVRGKRDLGLEPTSWPFGCLLKQCATTAILGSLAVLLSWLHKALLFHLKQFKISRMCSCLSAIMKLGINCTEGKWTSKQ